MAIVSIQTECPNCRHVGKVKSKYLGLEVACKECGSSFRISSHVQIPCPNCRRDLRTDPEFVGSRVTCKHCHHTFLARSEGERLIAVPSPRPFPSEPASAGVSDWPVSPLTIREDEVQPVRDALADRMDEADATGEQVRYAQGGPEELQDGVHDLHDRFDQAQGEHRLSEASQPAQEEARSKLDESQDQIRGLQEQVAGLALQMEVLEAARIEASRLEVAFQEAQATARRVAESRLEEIETLHAHRDRLQQEIQNLHILHEALRNEQDQLRDWAKGLQEQADLAAPLSEELAAARVEIDRLRTELRESQTLIALRQDELHVAASQSRDWEAARAHRDRLQEEMDGLRVEMKALQVERNQWEWSVAEDKRRNEATRAALAREFEDERSRRDVANQAMRDRWEQERHDLIQEAERRRGEEQARAAAELRRSQDLVVEAQRQIDRDRASSRDELERLSHEADASRREHRNLTAVHDGLQTAHQEAERRHQAEVVRLGQALEEVQRQAGHLEQRNEELNGQFQELEAESQRRQQDREAERQEHERIVAILQNELATARDHLLRPAGGTDKGPGAVPHKSETPSAPVSAEPEPHAGLYSDAALSDYNPDALRRHLRSRRR